MGYALARFETILESAVVVPDEILDESSAIYALLPTPDRAIVRRFESLQLTLAWRISDDDLRHAKLVHLVQHMAHREDYSAAAELLLPLVKTVSFRSNAHPVILYYLGLALIHLGDKAEGVRYLRECVDLGEAVFGGLSTLVLIELGAIDLTRPAWLDQTRILPNDFGLDTGDTS